MENKNTPEKINLNRHIKQMYTGLEYEELLTSMCANRNYARDMLYGVKPMTAHALKQVMMLLKTHPFEIAKIFKIKANLQIDRFKELDDFYEKEILPTTQTIQA